MAPAAAKAMQLTLPAVESEDVPAPVLLAALGGGSIVTVGTLA